MYIYIYIQTAVTYWVRVFIQSQTLHFPSAEVELECINRGVVLFFFHPLPWMSLDQDLGPVLFLHHVGSISSWMTLVWIKCVQPVMSWAVFHARQVCRLDYSRRNKSTTAGPRAVLLQTLQSTVSSCCRSSWRNRNQKAAAVTVWNHIKCRYSFVSCSSAGLSVTSAQRGFNIIKFPMSAFILFL